MRLAATKRITLGTILLLTCCGTPESERRTDFATEEIEVICYQWCNHGTQGGSCYEGEYPASADECYGACMDGCVYHVDCEPKGRCMQRMAAMHACNLERACTDTGGNCYDLEDLYWGCRQKDTQGSAWCAGRTCGVDENPCLTRYDDLCWRQWSRYLRCLNISTNPELSVALCRGIDCENPCGYCEPHLVQWELCAAGEL